MTLVDALTSVFSGLDFQTAIAVILLDVALGTIAALKKGKFRLSYFADFARNDVAFKLLPWVGIAFAAQLAGEQQIVIPGIDLGVIAGAFYVGIMAAWTGSLLSSMKDLGMPIPDIPGKNSVVLSENEAPPKA
jgi:hypothetical protein